MAKKMSASNRKALEPVDKVVGSPAERIRARRFHKKAVIDAATLGTEPPAPFNVWFKESWPKIKGSVK